MPLTCFTTVIDFVLNPFLTRYDAILGVDWSLECQHIGMSQMPENDNMEGGILGVFT
jgi:hypothetical protein